MIMSLDFYLEGEEYEDTHVCSNCFGEHTTKKRETLFDRNITHNLGVMAEAAGIYKALWRPEEIPATKAREIIPLLEKGLAKLKADPKKFEKHNAPNGWGTYEHFVPFVEDVLRACKEYPEAHISVSR